MPSPLPSGVSDLSRSRSSSARRARKPYPAPLPPPLPPGRNRRRRRPGWEPPQSGAGGVHGPRPGGQVPANFTRWAPPGRSEGSAFPLLHSQMLPGSFWSGFVGQNINCAAINHSQMPATASEGRMKRRPSHHALWVGPSLAQLTQVLLWARRVPACKPLSRKERAKDQRRDHTRSHGPFQVRNYFCKRRGTKLPRADFNGRLNAKQRKRAGRRRT